MGYPNTKLRKGPLPNETTLLFHGHPIGTIQRYEYDGCSGGTRVRWFVHTFDSIDHEGWGLRLREMAIRRLVHLYLADTGSSSSRHNTWVRRIKERIEGSTK